MKRSRAERAPHDRGAAGACQDAPKRAGWRRARFLALALAVAAAPVGLLLASRSWHVGERAPVDLGLPRQQSEASFDPGSRSLGLATPAAQPAALAPVTFDSLKQESAEVARRLVERFPDNVEALAVMAEVEDTLLGDSAQAVKYWEMCLQRDAGCTEAHYGMAMVAFKKGENGKAAAQLRKALEVHPAWCEGRILLARALMNAGEMEEAASVLEKNVETAPGSVETRFLLGRAYLQLGQCEKAKEHLLVAVQRDPESRYLYFQLATAYARLGEAEKARQCREKFQSLKTAGENWRWSMQERYPDVNVDLQVMRERTAWIHVRAGKVYYLCGQPKQGAREWQRAVALDPACGEMLAAVEQEFWQNARAASTLHTPGTVNE